MAQYADGATDIDIENFNAGQKVKNKGMIYLARHTGEWADLATTPKREGLLLKAISIWITKHMQDKPARMALPAISHIKQLKGSMAQRISHIRRYRTKSKEDRGLPVLATMHSSKGLEWDNTWIMACEDGIIPHIDSSIEEERRLFYVAMTRSKDRLYISHTMENAAPSRFLSEFAQIIHS